jgi:hypothetical protein
MIQRSPESPPLLIDLERIELHTNSTTCGSPRTRLWARLFQLNQARAE